MLVGFAHRGTHRGTHRVPHRVLVGLLIEVLVRLLIEVLVGVAYCMHRGTWGIQGHIGGTKEACRST